MFCSHDLFVVHVHIFPVIVFVKLFIYVVIFPVTGGKHELVPPEVLLEAERYAKVIFTDKFPDLANNWTALNRVLLGSC